MGLRSNLECNQDDAYVSLCVNRCTVFMFGKFLYQSIIVLIMAHNSELFDLIEESLINLNGGELQFDMTQSSPV